MRTGRWIRSGLALCAAALLAVAAGVATAETPPAPPPVPDPAKNTLGIEGTLTAASPAAFTITVSAAQEIEDGTWRKIPRPEFVGRELSVAVTPRTGIAVGSTSVPATALKPGMKIGSVVAPDVRPITVDRTFEALSVWIKSPLPGAAPGAPKPPSAPAPGATPPAPGGDRDDAPSGGEGSGPGVDRPDRDDFRTPFFARNWRMTGEVLGTDVIGGRNVVDFDVTRLAGRGFGRERSLLRESGLYLVVPARVVITDEDGDRIRFADLEADDELTVVARMAAPRAWVDDEDGDPYPTAVAKRIRVTEGAED